MFDMVSKIRFLFLPKLLRSAVRASRKRPVDIQKIRTLIEKFCSGTDFTSYFHHFEKYTLSKVDLRNSPAIT